MVNYFDLIIIYLACGAPVAVSSSFRTPDEFGFTAFARCLGAGLAWPLVVSVYLTDAIKQRGKRASHDGRIVDEIMHIGREIESSLPRSVNLERKFEAQDTFIRYAGLFIETKTPSGAQPDTELSIISGHQLPGIAEACFARRNRSRLNFAFENARSELFNLIERCEHSPQLVERILTGTRLIGDKQTEIALSQTPYLPDATREGSTSTPIATAA